MNSKEPLFPSERLAIFLAPVIGLAGFTALMAAVASAAGFHRDVMLSIAAALGCTAAVPAVALLYLQRKERARVRRALASAQERVGGIVEAAMDAIITVDERQVIVQFNAAAERVFRWPRAAVLGQPLTVLLPERFHAAHHGHIEKFGDAQATSRGMGPRMVLLGKRADGSEFPLEASISQLGEKGSKLFTVILRDVTETLRAEEMLARSEARLRGILDSAMDAIITVDERQHIVLFNRAAEEVFRCKRDDAVGAPLTWFIPERFRPGHDALVRRFGESGGSSRRMGTARVVMGLRRNGEEFPIEASISQIVEHGQHYYTVILRDVTERTRQDEALRRSRDEIRALGSAANTLREQEKSRVARELHDELGQALTAFKLDVDWLRGQLGDTTPAIHYKLASMQLLLDGTVAATRRIAADLRPLVLDDLGLAAAADWLVRNFTQRTGIPCELLVGAGFEEVADPHATTIFRVLQECLTNIAKHAGAEHVEVTMARERGAMTLVVRDDGTGFALDAPRKPASFGLLGLRERAALLGGEVSIESAPGRGTIVRMRLPLPETESTITGPTP